MNTFLRRDLIVIKNGGALHVKEKKTILVLIVLKKHYK